MPYSNGHDTTPGILHQPVLVLNQNYEPLNVCSLKRAVVLVFNRKAEILEAGDHAVRSATDEYEAPSVIRLFRLIKRPRPRVKLTRREIFTRDDYTCQYCGAFGGDLTVDHVIPRSKGGEHTWENVVTACRACNHRKGGKTLQEARLKLKFNPSEPPAGQYYAIERRVRQPYASGWLPFLPGLEASASHLVPNGSSD
jgi:5-methylcytosine-specific restriction endonuclease McrA